MTNSKKSTTSSQTTILQGLKILIEPGQIVELRALKVSTPDYKRPHTVSGYFDDLPELAEAAAKLDGSSRGIFITVNPVNPALLARAYNGVRPVNDEPLTSDSDVIKVRWLLVDCDPVRPSGISASGEEHELALERVLKIREVMSREGWPEPIVADSGNGAHLLYRVDLDPKEAPILRACLEALAFQIDDGLVTVDKTVFNPSRIWKLYGTTARKGDDTPDRPHRLSKIISVPESLR